MKIDKMAELRVKEMAAFWDLSPTEILAKAVWHLYTNYDAQRRDQAEHYRRDFEARFPDMGDK